MADKELQKKLLEAEERYLDSDIELELIEISEEFGIGYKTLQKYVKERRWREKGGG
jgi:uncharacterized protein YjcR